jgi:hypothetical protein
MLSLERGSQSPRASCDGIYSTITTKVSAEIKKLDLYPDGTGDVEEVPANLSGLA